MIFVGTVPRGTICDVFIVTLAGFSNRWIKPCTPELAESGTLVHQKHEPYVLEFSNNFPLRFRDVDWSNHLTRLLELHNKNIWIGTHHIEQQQLIKNNLGSIVKTVAINYSESEYDLVCDNWATHLILNKNFNKSIDELEKQKSKLLKNNNIPKYINNTADYTFSILDLYNKSIINKIEEIDGIRNKDQIDYYNKWYEINKRDK